MNGGTSGFQNAPVTRIIMICCAFLTVLFVARGRSTSLGFSYQDIIQKIRFLRVIASTFAFSSIPELMFGLYLLYYFRLFERQIGSNKYSVFILFSLSAALLFEVLALVFLKDRTAKTLASGPYGLIFASFIPFLFDIPISTRVRVFGIPFSDKSFIYLAGLQLFLSSWKRSLVPTICGLLAGFLYRVNVFGIRRFKSSGSGSESGIQGQKCTKSNSEDDSANNTGSNDEEDIGNTGLSARDGSDNGSGTQSSWTKRPFEADSPQPIYPSEQASVPHDSTCAHVIHPRPDAFYGNKMPANAAVDHEERKKIAADDIMASDPGNESNQTDKVSTKLTGPSTEKSPAENPPPKHAGDTVQRTNYNNALNAPPKHHADAGPPSSLDLSLKRLRSTTTPLNDERNAVLKHSNLSAFSRYPASAASVVQRNSVVPDNHCSNGSSSNGKGPGISKDASASAFQRVRSQGSAMQEKIDGVDVAPGIGQSKGSMKQVQVQHHHYHHYHRHIHALQPRPEQDGSSVEKLEANAANYSLNGSNSGSNHGSDGRNGCSAVVNAGGTNMDSAAGGVALKGGAGGGGGDGAYQNRFGQREAALNKFRQKRKERNFAKKVRYQSRKRLAEQRPRVRGQFVRRVTHSENCEEDS